MRVCGGIASQMHTGVKVRVRERDLNLPPPLKRLPWCLSGKGSACQYRRLRFDPWVRKIRWRRRWQPTPGFLPGKSHRQRSLVGYSPWGYKESDRTERRQQTEPSPTLAGEHRVCQLPVNSQIWDLERSCSCCLAILPLAGFIPILIQRPLLETQLLWVSF